MTFSSPPSANALAPSAFTLSLAPGASDGALASPPGESYHFGRVPLWRNW
jgi:hypothetical protein